jgi:VIT1/CCC1 family predicted Fe2+/Mn2+ transporter
VLRRRCRASARSDELAAAGCRLTLTFLAILIALVLTGWLAAWLTGLPVLRLVRRKVLLGGAIMAASILAGLVLA